MSKPLPAIDLLSEFKKFVTATKKGKRRNKDGNKIMEGSVRKLSVTYNTLKNFSESKSFPLYIRLNIKNNQREIQSDKIYWKKFYEKFTNYLYQDHDC